MSTTQPDRPYSQPEIRQSALSNQREPFVPPRQVLDMVSGRFLDPGTALAVNGVRPRSTVYVGPRLIVAETPDTAEVIERLREVAETLGWEVLNGPVELGFDLHTRVAASWFSGTPARESGTPPSAPSATPPTGPGSA